MRKEEEGSRLTSIDAFNLDRLNKINNFETGNTATLGFNYDVDKDDINKFNFFYNQFKESGDELAKKIGTNQALQNSPRYLVEFLAFSAIIFLILYLYKILDFGPQFKYQGACPLP